MGDELRWVDALETARLVRAREVSPTEVVEAAIGRIEGDPDLNAVVIPLFDEALAKTAALERDGNLDAPFAGVPFALKDVCAHQAGQPQYMGNASLRDIDRRTAEDSTLGARYRDAGLITVGKTNVPEFGSYPDTANAAFGPTKNPWDRQRSTSGSSGGSAAAVAAGLVPIAHGNDAGGSIRMPASWCGVVGFKPSRGRTPAPPGWEASFFCVEHVLTRTVADTALALHLTSGAEPYELYQAPSTAPSFLDAISADVGPLRIGVLETTRVEVSADVRLAVQATARALEEAGHIVEVAHPRGLFDNERFGHLGVINAFARSAITRAFADVGLEPDADQFGPVAKQMWEGPGPTAANVVDDLNWWQAWRRRIFTWWHDFDLLLTPSTGVPALHQDDVAPDPASPMMKMFTTLAPVMAFAQLFNMSGQPAISLPVAVSDEGLPIGVQLVGAYGRDDLVLAASAQIEHALPWCNRHPVVKD